MEWRISSIRDESPRVKSFELQDSGDIPFVYLAGQFLNFDFTYHGRSYRRSYSLSSTPGIDPLPCITVKRVENGLMSRWLIDAARVGDHISVASSATGLFTLDNSATDFEMAWFFAAGIGITPIFSLLKALLYTTNKRAVLVYSNRSPDTSVFYDPIRELERQFPGRLRIAWLWSTAKDLRKARFSKEYFPLLRNGFLNTNIEQVIAFICGPIDYMWLVQLLLEDAGLKPGQIRREQFITRPVPLLHTPADKDLHEVKLKIGKEWHSFNCAYPLSILDAGLAAGLNMLYSCKTGQCGSCTAICRSGKVWMSYNEVLTDADQLKGRVLTCTGHAVGGDVVLEF